MLTIRAEKPSDVTAREALLDVAYGASRFAKPSQRLRRGREAVLSFVAVENGRLVGTVRLWTVAAGAGRPALLLGPLAVAPDCRQRGIGSALMRRAIRAARLAGHRAIVLVGDAAYYGRFGFSPLAGTLTMPGQYEAERLLGLELAPAALAGARGRIVAADTRRPAARAAAHSGVPQAA